VEPAGAAPRTLERAVPAWLRTAVPPEARASLAGSLIDSLDEQIDEGAEAAWDQEIARRLRELDEGKVKLVPWAEARRRLARG